MMNNPQLPSGDLDSDNEKEKSEEEENIVVADMSMIDGKKSLFGRFGSGKKDKNQEKLTGSELKAFLRGTLSASLLIGAIYVVIFALLILFLTLIWK